jgi:3-dehydroquinate dehydratase I
VASVGIETRPKGLNLEGADLVEIRMDLVEGDPLQALGLWQSSGLPLIATNRMGAEGGAFQGSEEERAKLLIEASAYADFLDIELRAKSRRWLVDKLDLPVIISYHDFQGTPEPADLRSLVKEMADAGAFISKIAVTPRSLRDNLTLLHLLLEAETPLCIIAMGDLGRHLRAVAPIYGSALTYGYISSPTAPGQMSVSDLRHALDLLKPRPHDDPS